MDSTPSPTPTPTPTPTPIDPQSLSNKAKLPIKRKTPETAVYSGDDDPRPPPFKFHRIWTEPDEIRFLQGLLHSANDHLSFPRDLNIFYTRFSDTMSQPYTKSQLSEKLRRLRKKFRVISSRLSKGLDPSMLSPHDRALYNLSKQLWHPDFAAASPFSTSNCVAFNSNSDSNGIRETKMEMSPIFCNQINSSNLVGVKVSFSPNLPGLDSENLGIKREDYQEAYNHNIGAAEGVGNVIGFVGTDHDGAEVKLSEVNVEFEDDLGVGLGTKFEEMMVGQNSGGIIDEVAVKEEVMVEHEGGGSGTGGGVSANGVGEVAGNVVIDVFNDALEEVKMRVVNGQLKEIGRLEKRWHEQRMAELDAFARRMRLVLESSLQK